MPPSSRPTIRAARAARRPLGLVALAAGILALAAWYYRSRQPGLLIPDGYQYLLMARGIGEGLRPITRLGPDGVMWLPNPDASWKPLYPALVALLEAAGIGARTAAALVVAGAQAVLVAACAAAVWARTRSAVWAAGAAAIVAVSAPAHHWQSFIGPDALAAALAAAAAACLVARRPLAGGILLGLAASGRPEWGLVALALAGAGAAAGVGRGPLVRHLAGAAGAFGLVFAVVRPPVGADPRILAIAAAAVIAGAGAGALLRLPARAALAVSAGAATSAAAVVWEQERTLGLSLVVRHDPLVLAGVAGLLACVASRRLRAEGVAIAIAAAVLLAGYLMKNPDSERYLTQLVPLAAIAAGLAGSLIPAGRWRAAAAGVLAIALGAAALAAPSYLRGEDPLEQLARALPATSEPIIAGAPEGLAFHRPELSFAPYREGERGLILSDPISRESLPGLRPAGAVVARPDLAFAVRRRDGRIDSDGLVLVRGRLVGR